MIVIFASRYDESSYSLAKRWADQNASVLTCNDLSQPGWRHYQNSENECTAVVSGQIIPVDEVKGVLIRWPGVFEQELTHIAPTDRDYVAREMMAFLVSWFSSLSCPVINQPTPVSLTGPAWRREQWNYEAAKLGIPVQKIECAVLFGSETPEQTQSNSATNVTVIGNRCFGDVDEQLREQSRKLAHTAGVSLLNLSFTGPTSESFFLAADLLPKLTDEMADAVLEEILRREALAA